MSLFRNFFDSNQPRNHNQYGDQSNNQHANNNQPKAYYNTQYHDPHNPDNYQHLSYGGRDKPLPDLNWPLPIVQQLFPKTELGHSFFAAGRDTCYPEVNFLNNQKVCWGVGWIHHNSGYEYGKNNDEFEQRFNCNQYRSGSGSGQNRGLKVARPKPRRVSIDHESKRRSPTM